MSIKPEVRERIRAEMQPLIEAWRASGETRRTFAGRHGISLPKFDYWARQLSPGGRRTKAAARNFAEVAVVSASEAPGVLEVVLARGDRIIVRAAADVALVRTVLSVLGPRC